MKHYNFKVFSSPIWIFLVFFVSAGLISCDQVTRSHSVNISNNEQLTDANSKGTETQTEKIEGQNEDNSDNSKNADVSADNSIKQKDFKNLSYPWCSKIARLKDTVSLKDGKAEIIKKNGEFASNYAKEDIQKGNLDNIEYTIGDIFYGDFNSDNITDAFVSISTHAYYGKWYRSNTTCSYIYTMKENKPKLIWQYNYGEHKYSKVRKIEFNKAQNEIIFEMYYHYSPKGKFVGQLYRDTYSESYDRLIYKWENNTFRLISTQNIPYTKLQVERLGVVGLDSE